MAEKNERGQFILGHTGLGGRPKGARTKLGEAFIEALEADFKEHGKEAIKTVRETKPEVYVKVIGGLLPSNVNLNINNTDDVSDDELIQRIRDLAAIAQPFLGGADAGIGLAGTGSPADDKGGAGQSRQVH